MKSKASGRRGVKEKDTFNVAVHVDVRIDDGRTDACSRCQVTHVCGSLTLKHIPYITIFF